MSGQLSFLTSELQALSKEAGRRHGDVKEAADKALSLLKSSPESALSDLHDAEAPAHPSTSQAYPVLLAPIVLGCGTKNSKVISIAVSALQRLSGVRGAITEATVPLILQTLRSVLSQGVEIQLKILQTLVSLLTNCKDIHHDMLAETLLISFRLQESKIGVVSSTAAATLRQLIMFVFENVDEEDRLVERSMQDSNFPGPVPTEFLVNIPAGVQEDSEPAREIYLLPSARDAYLVFDDICLLINGEQPSFLKLQSLPRTFGLELVESVLSDFSAVFVKHPELLHLLRTLLSPLLIRALAEKPSFSTTLRLMRVMYLLLKKFNDNLIMESEIFLSMFIKIVAPGDTDGSGGHPLSSSMLPSMTRDGNGSGKSGSTGGNGSSPPWMRVLALEILRGLCGDFDLLSKIWSRYDATNSKENDSEQTTSVPVFKSMITALNRLATEKPQLLGTGTSVVSGVSTDPAAGDYSVSGVVDGIVGMAQQAATSVGVAGLTQGGLAVSSAAVKLQCIDQLDKADAPVIPETYVFLLALQCLNAISDGFASATLPVFSNIMSTRPRSGPEPLPAPPALDLDNAPFEVPYTALRTTKAMADAGWPALLASLSFFLTTNLDDELFTSTLTSYQNFTTACGVLALRTPRDAFLISLCKFAVPPSIVSHLASLEAPSTKSSQPASMLSAGADALGLTSQQPHAMSLSTRNLLCLRSLVGVSQALAGSLETTWFYVFEALQNADYVVRADVHRRQKKRSGPPSAATMSGSPSKAGASAGSASHHSTSGSSTTPSTMSRFVPSDADEQAAQQRNARLFEISKALDDTAFQAFISALCRLNSEMIGIPHAAAEGDSNNPPEAGIMSPGRLAGEFMDEPTGPKQPRRTGINVIRTLRPGEKSYAMIKLGEVSLLNMHRLISRPSEIGWDPVISHLLLIQHWQHAATNVRLQAAEVFDRVVSSAPRDVSDEADEVQKRVQEQILHALAKQGDPQPGAQTSTDIDVRKAALDTLFRVLEGQGHALLCGWKIIFDVLRSACPAKSARNSGEVYESNASTVAKTSLLVRVAFPSVQLICSDFLAALSAEELEVCIVTLAEFGRQTEDVNVALTAGGLLWQVSDHLQAKGRQDDSPGEYLRLWMFLLQRLLELCKDSRQEARDGAIQILWRSIELYGGSLDEQSWETCLWDVIFPLLQSLSDGVASAIESSTPYPDQAASLGVPLLSKQWDDSKILAIGSVGSVFANELPGSLAKLPSFEKVTSQLVDYLKDSFLHDRSTVATASMKCLDRICGTKWSAADIDKAQFVSQTAWAAWQAIGQQIVDDQRYDITQSSLEAYTKIVSTLQQEGHVPFDAERCGHLLPILKGVMTYPYSPDYRPDQDVLPPVQAAVLEVINRINLLSHAVVSAVLEDLSEYMTLAYTRLSDNVKSPSLSGGPRKQNQKITYVALSKACTTKVVEIYHRFKDQSVIYQSAVESILSAYSIPLRLKYECPAPSKFGEDQPLWKTATLHFLQLVRATVDSLQSLQEKLEPATVARIWRKIVSGFQAVLQADCRPAMDMTLDEQRMEEDFDLAVIVTIEMHILPKLGHTSVPDDAILALVRALRDASRLHELAFSEANGPLSPAMTFVGSNDSMQKESRFLDDYDAQASFSDMDGTTIEDNELPRERFAYWCLDLLFLMCGRVDQDPSMDRQRVAALALPLLYNRCHSVLRTYLADVAIRGRLPFTRLREEELVYILRQLLVLQLDEGIYAASRSENPSAAVGVLTITSLPKADNLQTLLAMTIQRSPRAHLFEFYPLLLSLVALPAVRPSTGHSLSYAAVAPSPKEQQSDLVGGRLSDDLLVLDARELSRRCLDVLGCEMGTGGPK